MRCVRLAAVLIVLLGLAPFAVEAQPRIENDAPFNTAKATFAGGCFWCMEEVFQKIEGVRSARSGYIGGRELNPSYEQVSAGQTGHAEAVEVVYDPKRVSFERLLDTFWKNIDPLTANRQFCDGGRQYRSAIFFHDAEQRRLAEASMNAILASKRFDRPIVTELVAAGTFYPAEDYHQDYFSKNPVRYKFYKLSCGRAKRLGELWGNSEH